MRTICYPSPAFEKLACSSRETPVAIRHTVKRILEQVCHRGDAALIELTRQLDGVKLRAAELPVPIARLRRARVSPEMTQAARTTFREVSAFAQASLPKNWRRCNGHGATVGEKFDPLERVGIYVPGGSVPLVSTIFMTVALARVAGVKEIVVCTPPPVAEPLLWALNFCGVREVYRVGGAQAIAAMAYGTKTIRPVNKVFGPGNAFVTEAKRQLFGLVGVDLLAGPSELMVLADRTTVADWAAADLLAQAEHGTGRERVFCVGDSAEVLKKVEQSLVRQAKGHPDNTGLRRVLGGNTWFIRARNHGQMAEVANRLAPEHLQIMTRQPRELAAHITMAGGIFLGNYTPTVLGDFVAGPSHTLPTGGAGRFFSGLRTLDFMRRTSLVEYSREAASRARKDVAAFAAAEKLPLHGRSLEVRG